MIEGEAEVVRVAGVHLAVGSLHLVDTAAEAVLRKLVLGGEVKAGRVGRARPLDVHRRRAPELDW